MKKRALSLLMAVIMVVSLLPTAVWAAEETDDWSTVDSPETFAAMTATGKYKLTKDITVSTPYASNFTGIFDGDGHTITLKIDQKKANLGLFKTLAGGAEVKNVTVTGSVTAGSNNKVGGIAGFVNVYSGPVSILNCKNDATISGNKGIGGIVGDCSGTANVLTVQACANTGAVTGSNMQIGGIVGNLGSGHSVSYCYNRGNISGFNYVGGIAGQCASSISYSYSTGNITLTSSNSNKGDIYGGGNGASQTNSFKLESTTDTTNIRTLLNTQKFIADEDKINDGYPILFWQKSSGGDTPTPPPAEPSISISSTAGTSIWAKASGTNKNQTTLSVSYENMGTETPDVTWNYPQDSSAANFSIAENTGDLVVTAEKGGVVEVTATVTFEEKEYSATMKITVIPEITFVEIKNVDGGAVAAGQTVIAKVLTTDGKDYDYDNYPELKFQFQWWHYDTSTTQSAEISGATKQTYEIPEDYPYNRIQVQITCNGQVVSAHDEHKTATVSSVDHGKFYPVAYDPDFTLPSVIKEDTQLNLPTSHTKGDMTATISGWTSNNTSVITNDGKVTCPDGPSVEVELKAKFTYSENPDVYYNRTFKITVWSKDESQLAQEVLNNAIDAAKLNTLYPTYGKDTNVLTMVEDKLNNPDISVSIKGVEKTNATDNSSNIADNGDVTFFYANPNNAPLQRFGTYSVTFTFTRDGITVERTIPVVVYWDQTQVKSAMTAEILDKVTVDEKNTVTEDFDLPKVVDGKKWTLISWQSSDPAITISTEKQTTADTLFDPYVAVVRGGSAEKKVTLTANFTFQLANSSDETSALTLHKTFTVNVAPSADGEKYQDALNAVFNDGSLKDITGDTITSADGVYSVSGDIQFPITGDLNRYMLDKYGEGSGFDGKYTPVLITSSDPSVIKAPDVANAARVEVYRPAPNQSAKTVTLTVRILDRPSGQGRDYANMPVLAEKTFTFQVQPITTEEVQAELDLMEQVKKHYWDGIKNGNAYPQDVTSDLDPFVEVYQQDGKLVWVRDVKQMTNSGIVPVAMDGWQELEAWRLFQSSNPTAVSHENLLVTRQFEGKAVTITSALSSETLGRYGQLYRSDKTKYADYASLADLYYQTVSANLIVRGYNEANMTEETVTGADGKSETIKVSTPKSETISVTFTLSGNGSLWMDTTTLSDLPEGTTVYDVLQQLQREGKLTFQHKGGYVSSITFGDKTLTELEEGENSGWMYRVNGVLPDVYMSAYGLKNGDNIRVFFTTDYTKESGGHGGSTPSTVPTTPQQPTGLPFTDVKAGAWYADAVKYVFEQGLMSGMSAQQFGPDSTVTRGQVVTILWRLAGSPTVSGKTFTDVSADAWYADAVAWASTNGVVSGYESGLFGPGDPVTREQLAAILYRYAQLSGKDTGKSADLSGYTDSVTISAWAPQALKWAVGSGLISGTGASTLSPRGSATRAQIAVILQNYCK